MRLDATADMRDMRKDVVRAKALSLEPAAEEPDGGSSDTFRCLPGDVGGVEKSTLTCRHDELSVDDFGEEDMPSGEDKPSSPSSTSLERCELGSETLKRALESS